MITLPSRIISGALCAVFAAVAWRPAPAHHSYSMFDLTVQRQVSGTTKSFEWTNPHVWLWITVIDGKGHSALYAFEGTSPGEMARRSGWSRTTVVAGDRVTATYHPFRDGKNGGRIMTVALPDGRTLDADSGYHPPPPPKPSAAHPPGS